MTLFGAKSENRYRALFDNTVNGIAIYGSTDGQQFYFADMNSAGEQLSLVKIQDIAGKEIREVFPGVVEMGLYDVLRRVWISGTAETLPVALYDDQSLSRYYQNRVCKISDTEVAAVYSDVSEQVRAEGELRRSEVRFRSLFETMQEGFALHEVVFDDAGNPVDYRFLEVNPAFERLTGLSRDAVLGRTVREIMPQTEEYWIKTYCQVAMTGEAVEVENYSDELGRYYRGRAYSPKRGKFVVLFEDVTEKKKGMLALVQREEQMRVLFDASQAGIVMVEPSGAIMLANKRMAEMFGCSMEELLRSSYPDHLHPDQRSTGDQMMRMLIAGEIDHVDTERHYLRKDGGDFWGHLSGRRHEDADGVLISLVGNIVDITDRRRAEEALRISEQKFFKAFSHAPLMMSISEISTGRYLNVNNKFSQISGFSYSEVVGRTSIELGWLSAAERDRMIGILEGSGRIQDLEISVTAKDGSPLTCLYSAEIINVEGVDRLLSIALDVTGHNKDREALAYANECFQQALNGPKHVLYRLNVKKGCYDYMSPVFEQITGYPLEQFMRTGLDGLPNYFHPEDRERFLGYIGAELAKNSGKSFDMEMEYRFRKVDGSYCWVHDSSTVCLDQQGEMEYIFGTVYEVTERKQAEEKLKQQAELLEFAHDCIIVRDLDDKITYWNRGAADCYGWEREEALGQVSHELLKTRFPVPLVEIFKLLLKDGMWQGELVHTRRDGRELTVSSRWSRIRSELDNTVQVLEINNDITDRLQLEREQEKGQRLESLGLLAGGIAHDFNNILTGIVGNLSLIRVMVNDNLRVIGRLDDCEKAARRAGELTRQLLTFSRGGEPVKKTVELSRILNESLSFGLRGSNVKGTLEISDELWPVDVDEGQISQVLNNLLINATQAMPDGGEVAVKAENLITEGADGEPGCFVRLSIRDSGSGISPDIMQKIFDPYFTTKPEGTGLGLASAYSIVRRHGGSIIVSSEVGNGAEFVICLPAICSKNPVEPETIFEDQPETTIGGRVLVMDDEQMIVELVCMMLAELGCSVDSCGDGREAVSLYQAALERGEAYDIVILDLTVPGGVGGLEACRRIRAIDPRATLIVSSGYSQDAVMADFREHGFSGSVMKPYAMKSLFDEFKRVMALRDRREQIHG
ncbi:MAG: PAS domain S-box protein [Geobacter sp.]|nr:PAS domain S-box protein [Geobacter sp.]